LEKRGVSHRKGVEVANSKRENLPRKKKAKTPSRLLGFEAGETGTVNDKLSP